MNDEDQSNLPTKERVIQANKDDGMALVINTKREMIAARVIDPLRIDKLHSQGVLDEKMHKAGEQLITLWVAVGKQFLRAMNYDDPDSRVGKSAKTQDKAEAGQIEHLTAQDRLYRIMDILRAKGSYEILALVCFDEIGMRVASKILKIHPRHAKKSLRAAFEDLENALEQTEKK